MQELTAADYLFNERVEVFCEASLGTPYHGGPLGEGPEGVYDQDPLIDLSRVDCVTFVEQVLALACSESYDEAVGRLQEIRYRDGLISYESRNHFMVADWVRNNSHFVRDVSAELGLETESVERAISKADFFDMTDAPDLGHETPDETLRIEAVPKRLAAEAAPRMPSPALVCFIGDVDWLFALHCGVFMRNEDGSGVLYHASSDTGEVVAVDFADYAEASTRRGFTVYALASPDPDTPSTCRMPPSDER
jgi:D-alanyl-D-alanine carboxypeptidase/D-alanyl-D-alanine-endopeptidase (penicillin-binding protein 4)